MGLGAPQLLNVHLPFCQNKDILKGNYKIHVSRFKIVFWDYESSLMFKIPLLSDLVSLSKS